MTADTEKKNGNYFKRTCIRITAITMGNHHKLFVQRIRFLKKKL
jgi:hypothetical protein